MAFDAGKITATLGAKVDERGFRQFDAQMDKAFAKASKDINVGIKSDTQSFVKYRKDVDAAKKVTTTLADSWRDAEKHGSILQRLVGLFKWPAYITGVGLAAQGTLGLTAGVVALGSALAPVSGALVLYPALLGAIGAAAGVVALSGIGKVTEAVGGLNEKLDKTSDAYKQLTPQGQAFARVLQSYKDPVRDLQKDLQKGLFPGLVEGLDSALPLMDKLRVVLTGTAGVMGRLATRAGELLGRKAFGKDFEKIGITNNRLLENLGESGLMFGDALRHIMVAAKPLINWLGRFSKSLGESAKNSAEAGRRTGTLTKFFEKSRDTIKQLVRIGTNLGKTFGAIGEAAAPLGEELLGRFEKMTKGWAKFTGSVEGSHELDEFFERQEPMLKQLGKLIGAVAGAFLEISETPGMTQLLRTLRTDLLPVLTDLVVETTELLAPSLISAASSFLKLLTNFAGTIGPLGSVASVLGGVADALNAIFNLSPLVKTGVITFLELAAAISAIGFAKAISEVAGFRKGLGALKPAASLAKSAVLEVASGFRATRVWASFAKDSVSHWASSVVSTVKLRTTRIRGVLSAAMKLPGRLVSTIASTAAGEWVGGLLGSVNARTARVRAFFTRWGGRLGLAAVAGFVTYGLADDSTRQKIIDAAKDIGEWLQEPITDAFEAVINSIIKGLNVVIDGLNQISPFGDIGKLDPLPSISITPDGVELTTTTDADTGEVTTSITDTPGGGGGGGGGGGKRKRSRGNGGGGDEPEFRINDQGVAVEKDSRRMADETGRNFDEIERQGSAKMKKLATNVGRSFAEARRKGVTETKGLDREVGSAWKRITDETDRRGKQMRGHSDEAFDKMHERGSDRLEKLRKTHSDRFGQMVDTTRDKGAQMRDQADEKLGQMAEAGEKQGARLSGAIGGTMASSSNAVYTSFQYIQTQTVKALKTFGVKQLPDFELVKPKGPEAEERRMGGPIGGHLPGSRTGDLNAAYLEDDEYVLNRNVVKALGKRALDRLNFKMFPRFKTGGLMDRATSYLRRGGAPNSTVLGEGIPATTQDHSPGRFVPVPGFPGEQLDNRLLADWQALQSRYQLYLTDGFSLDPVHSSSGEHPIGAATDIAPAGSSWDLVNQLAAWAEPSQGSPIPPWMWVGYNGDAGHGEGNHLHLSWTHGPASFGHPAEWVETMSGISGLTAHIGKMRLKGPNGFPKAVASAAINRTRKGANRFLMGQAQRAPGFETGGSGDIPTSAAGINSAGSFIPFWNSINPDLPEYGPIFAQIIPCESGWSPTANNGSHAGWYQFDAATWSDFGDGSPWPSGPYNPIVATRAVGNVIRAEGASGLNRWTCWNGQMPGSQKGGLIEAVRRFAKGGHMGKALGTSVFTDQEGYHGDSLYSAGPSFAELGVGGGVDGALGHLPYKFPLLLTNPANGKQVWAKKLDIGQGGGPVNGLPRSLDLHETAARKLGVSPTSFLGTIYAAGLPGVAGGLGGQGNGGGGGNKPNKGGGGKGGGGGGGKGAPAEGRWIDILNGPGAGSKVGKPWISKSAMVDDSPWVNKDPGSTQIERPVTSLEDVFAQFLGTPSEDLFNTFFRSVKAGDSIGAGVAERALFGAHSLLDSLFGDVRGPATMLGEVGLEGTRPFDFPVGLDPSTQIDFGDTSDPLAAATAFLNERLDAGWSQFGSFQGARRGLFSQFGANFGSGGVGAQRPFGALAGVGRGVVDSGRGGGVIQHNYFRQGPVDPHTWSRNTLFELRAGS